MRQIRLKHIAVATAALAALGLTTAAIAQYVWVNEKGVKQYSDMPPPASVPKNRILKEPDGSPPQATSKSAEKVQNAADAGYASASEKRPMTSAEKNADFQKRKAEQAEKEKKAAEQEKQAQDKIRNCQITRDYKRSLESGERIRSTDKNGERGYLTDEQRAQEVREANRAIGECQ